MSTAAASNRAACHAGARPQTREGPVMLTKRCGDCGQVKPVELFDRQPTSRTGRASACKDCRRQRQVRGGYGAARNRALWALARRHPQEYQRHYQQARRQLAPDTAPAGVWHAARGRALAELARRHQHEWQQCYRQLRTEHPDWPTRRVVTVATNQQRTAHHQEYMDLLARFADARPAGHRLIAKLARRAQRQLQLAHPAEYQALYAAERAKLSNPTKGPRRGGHAR
jgi:hypothetical protein